MNKKSRHQAQRLRERKRADSDAAVLGWFNQLPAFLQLDEGKDQSVAEELIDLALRLAREGFDEHVDALVEAAGNHETGLALAAAQVSTEPPMQSGSVDQIAYSLLVEAFQRASRSKERSSSLDDVA